jgi:hypothetical protein
MAGRVTAAAPKQLLAPGTYWCAVVAYADGSGLINVYGPYPSRDAAEQHAAQLKAAGVNAHQSWDFEPLHLIDLGVTTSE